MPIIIDGEFEFESKYLDADEVKHCFNIIKTLDYDNPPTTVDIVRKVTNDPTQDTRSRKGREIKKLFEQYGAHLDKPYIYKKQIYILTAEEKSAVNANLTRYDKPLDLARFVFNDKELTNLSRQYRAMEEYINKNFGQNLKGNVQLFSESPLDEIYKPPSTPLSAFREVKKYIKGLNVSEEKFPETKYFGWMNKLKDYLQDNHFVYYINHNLKTAQKRELFLSAFIKHTYNKPDLTEEEKEQYIALCSEIVDITDLHQKIELINEKIDGVFIDEDKDNISMSLLKTREGLQKSLDEAKKRREQLIKVLDGSRADKKKNQKETKMSFVELINYWRDEENRKRMIKVAEARQEELRNMHKEVSDCDSLIAEIWGAGSEDDVLFG